MRVGGVGGWGPRVAVCAGWGVCGQVGLRKVYGLDGGRVHVCVCVEWLSRCGVVRVGDCIWVWVFRWPGV